MTTDDRPIPTNDKDRKAFKDALAEMTHCMRRMDDEREQLKDIAKGVQDTYGIKTKLVRKLATTMYKHDYANVQAENEHFEHLYESLIEGKKVNP